MVIHVNEKNNGPRSEPCSASAGIDFKTEDRPLRTTAYICCLKTV